MKVLTLSQQNFQLGLHLREDDTLAPFGSSRKMINVQISDRNGITTRPGTQLLGTKNTSSSPVKGLFNFKKSQGSSEIPLKAYSTFLEYYHPVAGWSKLKTSFTSEQEFGFTSSLVNTSNEDYCYFCNRTEEFQRWRGAVTLLNGAVSAAATTITVDTTLKDSVYYSATATANSATTLTVSGQTWATDMWKNFVIHIVGTGKVRRITSNGINSLTFDTLGVGPGNVAFEVRRLAFPLYNTGTVATNASTTLTGTGTNFLSVYNTGDSINVDGETVRVVSSVSSNTVLISSVAFTSTASALKHKAQTQIIYNDTAINYTDIDLSTTFTVASAHAGSDNQSVAVVPQTFTAAPRGNRLENLFGRVYVGNVRSAVSRDSAGALQGSDQAGSVFVSKILDPSTFTFSATRIAGDGDILNMPYGGGEVTDLAGQESTLYAYKKGYIEAISYSQDSNDFAIRVPIKTGRGSVGKVIRGSDDQYFITIDKQYTSLGRVKAKDILPQTENFGLPIKRLLDSYDHSDFNGIEYRNRIYSCHKTTSDETSNNAILIYNKLSKSFEGIWSLSAGFFFEYQTNLYYAESSGANVWQMLVGKSDIESSSVKYPVTSEWLSNFFNATPIRTGQQGINSVLLEGYITPNTSFTFSLYKDFSDESAMSFTFGGTEENLIVGDTLTRFMGSSSLALLPMGTIDAPGSDGRRRFIFQVYFPYIYGETFSTGISSSGKDQDWEMIRISLGLKEDVSTIVPRIKSL